MSAKESKFNLMISIYIGLKESKKSPLMLT